MSTLKLTKRERQIMDIIHELGQATASQVREKMDDAPSNAAVRYTMRTLLERGHLTYEQDGPRYLYSPTAPVKSARKSALKHVLTTFFGGSVEGTIAALLDLDETKLSDAEQERVRKMIEKVQKEGR